MAVINSTSQIANKVTRSKVWRRLKHEKTQAKLRRRVQQKKDESADPSLRRVRLEKNVSRTIEGTKEWLGCNDNDERTLPVRVEVSQNAEAAEGGEEMGYGDIKLDMGRLADLFTPYEEQATGKVPEKAINDSNSLDQAINEPTLPDHKKILITTSPRPSDFTLAFIHELKNLLGGERHCDVIPRKTKHFELRSVCRWACKRSYGSMVVIGEAHGGRNRSGPTHMMISRLPFGPSACFRLTSIVPSKAIPGHANATSHFPELVLSNFSTPLGLSVGTLLQSIFPPLPELGGRQVVSLQNQRDFIFVRRFRYAFAERDKLLLNPNDEAFRARLQEIGPRFTLKIRWLKRGTLAGGLNASISHSQIGKERKLGELEQQQEGSRHGRRRITPKILENNNNSIDSNALDLENTPIAMSSKKKSKRKSKTSAGVEENFLEGYRSDSEDPETSEKPRKGGGMSEYMKDVKGRASQGRNTSRELEWEWKPKMGVSRRKFAL
ncbi:anticodon-binding protein [Phakopsora pachyrhizi]|uniref:Anticodon-binding protein n=1 Tax=Phakopsora pachyrhizi TaxID=170000 RepID=A0AAV0BDG1_PHAPC|nr:anticodon-binding protein [Phakopsora pachyrhizi]KAI8448883.1 anticodon-binding protein [Phakopsora pachyrhizi]CAH7683946.1 anticodon-binding protein [Phakopsora pachyrhizi]CAH7684118.1 anticodon-binding protein [Phakopsora pachyrhizi]